MHYNFIWIVVYGSMIPSSCNHDLAVSDQVPVTASVVLDGIIYADPPLAPAQQ